jgi:uncharacterized protein with LGFP repeats
MRPIHHLHILGQFHIVAVANKSTPPHNLHLCCHNHPDTYHRDNSVYEIWWNEKENSKETKKETSKTFMRKKKTVVWVE